MQKIIHLILIGILTLSLTAQAKTRHFPLGSQEVSIPNTEGVRKGILKNIAPVVKNSIKNGLYPGAVILAGHNGKIIYRGIFGNRRIVPNIEPMTFHTIFDLASLTKVFVTTTAVMQLVEQGRIDLDMPVSYYWPEFSYNGKGSITVRQLLTHTSGFPEGLTIENCNKSLIQSMPKGCVNGKLTTLSKVILQPLVYRPGTAYKYSDVNFITLGYLVERITNERLDKYANQHIFSTLGLKHTYYTPPSNLKERIAPTELVKGNLRWGEVHDDTAKIMGGVSGMAGVFADAADLGKFAQCIVDRGRIDSIKAQRPKYLLGPLTVLNMTKAQTPSYISDVRGLGWDIDNGYYNRRDLFTSNSFGHTGFTGTSIWIDPETKTWLIILTSRTHPKPLPINPLIRDRKTIANIVAASIIDVPR